MRRQRGDGAQSARVVAFAELAGGVIVQLSEYRPTAYAPLPGRAHRTEPIPPIP